MASKKGGVKWEVPEIKESRTPRKEKSQKETVSERLYTDTFEDTTNIYSDTFLTESYSDTFVTGTVETEHKSSHGSFRFTQGPVSLDQSETDQIQTVITEGIQTVIEVDSGSEFPGTAIDTELQDTLLDTVRDISDTHPTESYSDTFESADKTRTEFELRTESAVDSQRSYTPTFTQSSRTFARTTESDDLDMSYIAPDYDGKSLSDDEYEADTDHDDYSDTFEPTELTTQISEVQNEETYDRHERQAQEKFVDRMLGRFKDKELVKDRGLQVISPDHSEESEDEYLKHYCKKKMKQLRRKRALPDSDSSVMTDDIERMVTSNQLEGEMLSDYGLQDCVIERAKLTNIMSAMKRAAKRKIHEVKNCPECSELKSRLEAEDAERLFTDSRVKMLKSKMMDIHVENHILKMNSISLIGELARQLPRSSEKPEKIMDQLLEPLLGKNVMR